ncbi:Acetyltransferase (GNAT) domain-containing protein [Cognatiyoonia sediminum]|uniref:Acetyltransferase (GNAT) domain-containing protein n=1 Tax=Cognatiyoonia sediminum TaxID=1508389 RepID=A0A1M5MR22_9RHOB|nr:GNAT family N-acetyltransferase [Cognatiyoonia sediminum]SHG79657.1 Acetyltransferase (GNAT) domain-containing protein [Cognatiyoonia sediminum]
MFGTDKFKVDFTTARLRVQSWNSGADGSSWSDIEVTGLRRLLTPAVLRHLPPSMHLTDFDSEIQGWVGERLDESNLLKVSFEQRLVGLVILAVETTKSRRPNVHIGYLLAEDTWGQGLASELIVGLVEALSPLAPVRLVGGVERGNSASARVLEKAGFACDAQVPMDGVDTYFLDIPETG